MSDQLPASTTTLESSTTREAGPDNPTAGIVTFMERPSYVPAKFFNAKTGEVNFQEMAKSYTELEKSKSAQPAAVEPAKPAEKSSTDAATADRTEPPAPVVELPEIPGVANEAMKSYSAELTKDGKLSDASYTALTTAGYPKAVVDAYLKGLTADSVTEQATQAAVAQARIADTQIAEITDGIGGKQALTDMQAWARASMSPEDLKTYNESVSSGDVAKVRLAVAGLKHAYTQVNGSDPNLIGGRSAESDLEAYGSQQEVTAAINDARYAKDPAYRAAVAAKLGRSSL